jgi:hypothetical protein
VKSVEMPKPPVEVLRTAATVPANPPAPPQEAPAVEDDPLTAVAQCLEREDYRGAAVHLHGYVRAHPDQLMFRFQLADFCLRGGMPAEAKFHYERFVAEAQSGPATLRPHLVTAHTKLMEIAQHRNDRFGELFHRGVGLLLLVKQMDATPDRDDPFCEEMLCKSLRALSEAKELKPGDPRVRLYLAEVLERTGNKRAAGAERSATRTSVTSGELTASERRPLLLE